MSRRCGTCAGGVIKPVGGSGRTWPYRVDWAYSIPDDLQIPTCTRCGELYADESLRQRLDAEARAEFGRQQQAHLERVVDRIREQVPMPLKDLERACGVTRTYLSHVLKGRREAGDPLTYLLEAFARYPEELKRRLETRVALDTESCLGSATQLADIIPLTDRLRARPVVRRTTQLPIEIDALEA